MRIGLAVFAAALAAAVIAEPSAAQEISGTVTVPGGEPVAGAAVFLADSQSRRVARALTDDRGEFRLVAPRPGTFKVRVVRIGYVPMVSDPVVIGAGERKRLQLNMPFMQLVLDTVRVRARPVCAASASDVNGVAFQLLDQARAALTATQLSAEIARLLVRGVGFERHMERTTGVVRFQRTTAAEGPATQPWSSVPAEILRRDGYVSTEGEYTVFHAPNLDAFTSGAFEEDHCFRVVDGASPGTIGLHFEPTLARRHIPEITGTLWLDRATAELRRIEFRYTNARQAVTQYASGTMSFARLSSGLWLIARWRVVMPLTDSIPVAPSLRREPPPPRLLRVEGGEVIIARQGEDTIYARKLVRLTGRLLDSISGRGIPNARLSAAGTDFLVTTDSAGRYALDELIPGLYAVEIGTQSLDSIGAAFIARMSIPDSASPRDVRVPTASIHAPAICRDAPRHSRAGGMVFGQVMMGDVAAPSGVSVTAAWQEPVRRGKDIVGHRPVSMMVRTDSTGMYRLCGLPENTVIVVSADSSKGRSAEVTARIDSLSPYARMDLVIVGA